MASSLIMFKKLKSVKTKILLSILLPILVVIVALGFALSKVTDNLIDEHIIPQYDQNLLLDKSNKTEKQIMYKMIFDRNYPSPNDIPLDIFDVKINNDIEMAQLIKNAYGNNLRIIAKYRD